MENDAHDFVTKKSSQINEKSIKVEGYDFEGEFNFDNYIKSLYSTGNQSTPLFRAIKIINEMISEKLRLKSRMKIYLGFTSNIGSSGMREIIAYLCRHRMIDIIVTTGGAIEEDIMKTKTPHYILDTQMNDTDLRDNGINRIYNMYVPNDNYVCFETFMNEIIKEMVEKQKNGFNWTPSKLINLLGGRIEGKSSWVRNCYEKGIKVFSPAIIDGSIGDMIYFNQNTNRELKLDTIEDLCEINNSSIFMDKTAFIILGAGLVKHHILNANLMRNGADYAVLINLCPEEDGSDAGAGIGEAKSWGKIAKDGKGVKVFSEVSLVLPTIIASTFKKFEKEFDALFEDEKTNK